MDNLGLLELKNLAQSSKKDNDYDSAVNYYEQIWELEKNQWNGYFLVQSYRKVGDFSKANEFHTILLNSFPDFLPLNNERLWLIYDEKIKDWKNQNLLKDAEDLISRVNQYDKYTGSIYSKTIIKVVKTLRKNGDFETAYLWILKLDQSVLSENTFNYGDVVYPSDRKVYYVLFSDILVTLEKHVDFFRDKFKLIGFSEIKSSQFLEEILGSITYYESYSGDFKVSRRRFAIYLKLIMEEISLRSRDNLPKIFNSKKLLSVSDLSHFSFCPVSFSIQQTYRIDANSSWEKDEWKSKKRIFSDRLSIFNKSKKYEEAFLDTKIKVTSDLEIDFQDLFMSKILVNNFLGLKPQIFYNNDKTLMGSPDYVLEDSEGSRFLLIEKFSSIHSADVNTPFESDLIKHYGYLDEFKNNGFKYSVFLTWYWDYEDSDDNPNDKKMVVQKYRLIKLAANDLNYIKFLNVFKKVKDFKASGKYIVDSNKISHPKKCLNCSVFSYCDHKTGRFNEVSLPYSVLQLKDINSINIELDTEDGECGFFN